MRLQVHIEISRSDGQRLDRLRKLRKKTNGNATSRAEYTRQALLAALDRDESESGPAASASGGLAGSGPAGGKR